MQGMDSLQAGPLKMQEAYFSERDAERLLHVLDASIAIRQRSQFFLWVQGQLQGLIPHELLICVHGDLSRRALLVEHFSSFPVPEADMADMTHPDTGFVGQMLRAWIEGGEKPLCAGGADVGPDWSRRFESVLYRHRLGNVAAHGMPVQSGVASSFFVFARVGESSTARLGHALDLVVPHVHRALVRVLGNDSAAIHSLAVQASPITAREIEILQWIREGKSNQEIGDILGISALTVKNHVQKILKKLNVQNRAQAVARGISLQLIKSNTY